MSKFLILELANATLCGKKNFADVSKLGIFRWGDYTGLCPGDKTTSVSTAGKKDISQRSLRCEDKARGWRDAKKGYEPRTIGSLQTIAQSFKKEGNPGNKLAFSQMNLSSDFWPPKL